MGHACIIDGLKGRDAVDGRKWCQVRTHVNGAQQVEAVQPCNTSSSVSLLDTLDFHTTILHLTGFHYSGQTVASRYSPERSEMPNMSVMDSGPVTCTLQHTDMSTPHCCCYPSSAQAHRLEGPEVVQIGDAQVVQILRLSCQPWQ